MELERVKNINTTALAYMGDGVYEIYIRKMLMEKGGVNVNLMHKEAISYVSAFAQAKAIKAMVESFLDDDEIALVKRARNHKIASKAKNADPMTYKWATAFEALIGFLYLSENTKRMEEVITKAIEIIGEE
ncbi:MAG: ribonuclease III [Clostridia bacterium]|nr:ribonuclease III [Clostridia bacterium]